MRWRAIALPAEHGSWGLVLEPIVLGLLVASSAAGACAAASAFAAFLLRRPFKVLWAHRRRPADPRLRAAAGFLLAYGAVFLAGLAGTVALAGWRPLLPLLLASPLLLVFLAYDLDNQSRRQPAELAGGIVFATTSTGIALAGGWDWGPAVALGGAVILRSTLSILYVRARIRLDRGITADRAGALAAHLLGLSAAIAVVLSSRFLPALSLVAFAALAGRAAIGLSSRRPTMTVRAIGYTELGFGILVIGCLAAGYWSGV